MTRHVASQWRKLNSRAAIASTAARSLPSSRARDLHHPRHNVAGSLHSAQQPHREVDVKVDHGYIVFAPLTASKTAYSEVVAQM